MTKTFDRRTFLKGTTALAAVAPFAGLLGSTLMAAVAAYTGSLRPGVLLVGAFFAVGLVLLARVDVAAGERAARRAEGETRSVPPG